MLSFRYLKKNHIRVIFFLLIGVIFLYNINVININQIFYTSQKDLISCYFEEKHPNSLPELNPSEVTENSIFFVETSCNHNKGIKLNLRQGCAIESAARLNPSVKVFVLFLAPNFVNNTSNVISRLNMYANVNLRYINFLKYSYKTPLQNFVTSNTIFTSHWPVSHTSDLLRFLTLWKFGGTYLDLDVVLMKPFKGIKNFVSAESNITIASLVLNFGADSIGKNVANTAVNEFANNYRGNNWGYNGPGVVTRTLKKICETDKIYEMNKEKCKGFTLFGLEAFCPIEWTDWNQYFNASISDEVMAKIKDSIGIHVWNLHSKHKNITVGSKEPYALVAQKYCPTIFSLAKYVF